MNKTNQKRQRYGLAAAAAALMLGFPYAAHATDYTWNGEAGDSKWTTAANWMPMGVPGAQDTAYVGGNASVQLPGSVTLKNLRLGADAAILNDGNLNVTGWTSSDGVVEGTGELNIPDGAAATINLSPTILAANPLRPRFGEAWCKKKGKNDDKVKFGKVKNKGKLRVNIASAVDVEFADITNDGGETMLSVAGSDATPIKLKALKNESGTITLKGTGKEGRAFEGEAISNKGKMVFDGSHTQTKNDYANAPGATMTLKGDALLDCAGSSKKLENQGLVELPGGDAEIRMEWKNKGRLVVESGNRLRIAAPDGKKATQDAGVTTLNDGTLEIVDSVSNPADGGLQIKGGVLDGSGTIEGNVTVDGGSLKVGHSPGLMIINGNYTQTANGLMDMEVWGTVPGYLYDQLRVQGNAYLNGALTIDFGNGFVPGRFAFWHVKYVFRIGKFSSVRVNNPAPGRIYRLIYSTSGVYSSTDLLADPNAATSYYGIDFKNEKPRQYIQGL